MAAAFQKHKFGWTLITAAILLGLSAALLPWKPWVEGRLKGLFEAQGLTDVRLTLSHVGLTTMTLEDITFGNTAPLTLKNVTLDYSMAALLAGDVRGLTATGLSIEAHKQENAWNVIGLEHWENGTGKNAPFTLPITLDELNAIPLSNAQLNNSHAHIASDQWQLDLPLQLQWQKQPTPKVAYVASGIAFKTRNLGMTTGAATAEVLLKENDKRWEGSWSLQDIHVTGTSPTIPALNGGGELSLQSDQARITGQLHDAAKTYTMAFAVNYLFAAPDKSAVVITDFLMPWTGGSLAAHNVRIPLSGQAPIDVTLRINQVSADTLMQQLTGKRASATGKISGTLPATLEPDGSIVFHEGTLHAEEPGTITMSPEVIPGDNEQVALVREVLKDFHYTSLAMQLNSGEGHRLELRMNLEGNNPQVQAGRRVKINVNLNGDVLDFVQQNLLWLSDPQKIMERGKNANP